MYNKKVNISMYGVTLVCGGFSALLQTAEKSVCRGKQTQLRQKEYKLGLPSAFTQIAAFRFNGGKVGLKGRQKSMKLKGAEECCFRRFYKTR